MKRTDDKFSVILPGGYVVKRKINTTNYFAYVVIKGRKFSVDKWDENEEGYPYTVYLTISNGEWVNYGDTKYSYDRSQFKQKVMDNEFFKGVK